MCRRRRLAETSPRTTRARSSGRPDFDQGGQLLREVEDLAGGTPRRAEQRRPDRPSLVGRLDAAAVVVLAMEALDDRVRVERLHHAVDGLARPRSAAR